MLELEVFDINTPFRFEVHNYDRRPWQYADTLEDAVKIVNANIEELKNYGFSAFPEEFPIYEIDIKTGRRIRRIIAK